MKSAKSVYEITNAFAKAKYPLDIINLIKSDPDVILMKFGEFSRRTGVFYHLIPSTFGSSEAFHIRQADKAIIVYNDLLPINRLRFTLAHEYAHYIMEHEGVNLNQKYTYNDFYRVKLEEYEANTFASCLLFPLHMRYKYYENLSIDKVSSVFHISNDAAKVGIEVIKQHMSNGLENYMSIHEKYHPENYINYLSENVESELDFIMSYQNQPLPF